ncbi:DUF4230 domain-containing protein [Chitinophaga nivalis]|uniref:DUF4230 domain-containing protein n=1 Tax=Chitinophaga nivalis TaxID=2991709 RepID=A0ABT3IRR5_9BACT|nr:DUF4230 domain-containing protein [Chitinophaga nivalis]MCW3463865.1 DUF4230 domain-containing protein [Chitinophaga nivalis]MCW3486445.1 DUF4230 domain-containing protein [Chitinophaga nivalis]
MKKIIYLAAALLLAILIFWLGKRFGGTDLNQQVISNSTIIKEIAELASLDVQGNASLKRSNVEDNGDWGDNIRKTFLENTVWVSIPYQAKYGVNINDKTFRVATNGKKITISLPAPVLLSYELKMDKMETANRKGWLLFQNDETYTDAQKKLYQTSRAQLENNTVYIEHSKAKIRSILHQYYAPFLKEKEYTLDIQFGTPTQQPPLQ